MKLLFIIIAFLIAGICAGAQADDSFITFDNPSLTREERIIKHQVEKHRTFDLTIHDKQYIYNPVDAIADQEFAEDVQRINGLKPGEHYTGK
jgi:hypothetical protein